jgi:dienelactone hydrolase
LAQVTERRLSANGLELHLAEAGPASGSPVVLLHGFPDSWRLWRHQVQALAGAGHRVLAPDTVVRRQPPQPAKGWWRPGSASQ